MPVICYIKGPLIISQI